MRHYYKVTYCLMHTAHHQNPRPTTGYLLTYCLPTVTKTTTTMTETMAMATTTRTPLVRIFLRSCMVIFFHRIIFSPLNPKPYTVMQVSQGPYNRLFVCLRTRGQALFAASSATSHRASDRQKLLRFWVRVWYVPRH